MHVMRVSNNTGVLVLVGAALGGDHVFLAGIGAAGVDVAVLEDSGGIAEDEIDGAGDVAVDVELAVGVDVKGVLVGDHVAVIEGGKIGTDTKGHGLVL